MVSLNTRCLAGTDTKYELIAQAKKTSCNLRQGPNDYLSELELLNVKIFSETKFEDAKVCRK